MAPLCCCLQNFTSDDINYSSPLSKADFDTAMLKYDISKQLLHLVVYIIYFVSCASNVMPFRIMSLVDLSVRYASLCISCGDCAMLAALHQV